MTTNRPLIAEQVTQLNAQVASQAPAEALAAFAEEQTELDAAGVPANVASAGSAIPDGKLLSPEGQPVSLQDARQGRAAVVVFYRGAWCPYCNLTLRTYQQQLQPELDRRGVALIAISPQKPDGSLTTRETNDLTFTVLSDPGNQVATHLGILTAPSDGARAAQGQLGVDVASGNGDGTDTLPMPTVVVVDRDGIIRWIDVHPNYTTRSEPDDIISAVDSILVK
jgi:peroxiredoxin